MQLTHVPLLTLDQEKDLQFWKKLGWQKKDDSPMGENQRWLTICNKSQPNLEIVLQSPDWGADSQSAEERKKQVGKQSGLCFSSADIEQDYKTLQQAGAILLGKITKQPWGKQLLFQDLSGNTHVVVGLTN